METYNTMTFEHKIYDTLGVTAEIATYAPEGMTAEHHIMLHVNAQGESFYGQLTRLQEAEAILYEEPSLAGSRIITKRYFCTDAVNQSELIANDGSCATGIIQQPPLDGSKIAVWIYMQEFESAKMIPSDATGTSTMCVQNNGYTHYWDMGMQRHNGDSFKQTKQLLEDYESALQSEGINIADNCIRTWFFVRDVDIQYAGMVKARRENFDNNRLTRDTHYLASTGICGLPTSPDSILMLDAYAVKGIAPEQQQYLYAKTHLNPTIEYGVTFERGTRLILGDRSHLYISGTASIDNKGQVVHLGDITRQTLRMWENVEKLLEEGGASFRDIAQIIVYLRDLGDYELVNRMFREKFPNTPYIITHAPVCRPTWLIEMECIAITSKGDSRFKNF